MQEPGAHRIAVAEERDCLPAELDGARRRARQDGLLGGPGRELGEVEPGELGGVRHVGPQRERALEVRERLGEAEDRLRLARRLDRRDERLPGAACRRPVRRELGRGRRRLAARELVGEPRVQLLALAGQQRGVDRLGEERVAEAKAPSLIGDEDAVLDGTAQRLAHVVLRQPRRGAQQRVADVAPGRGRQPQHALRPAVEARHASQQQLAQPARELAALVARRGEELLGEERVALRAGDDRVDQRRRRGAGASLDQRRQLVGASGPSSSTSAAPERPTLSASRRTRSADAGSSAR